MDIGTKKEPGRELSNDEARDVNGGFLPPEMEDPTKQPSPDDPFGGDTPMPVDYSTP